MKKVLFPLCIFLFVSLVVRISAQSVIYVDASANGIIKDGSSWVNAYTDLQDALNSVSISDADTIWVAEGSYKPDAQNGTSAATFLIESNIVLLGGFPTGGGVRNPQTHPTILSGDLNGDDIADDFINFKSDNVNTVVTIAASTSNATLLDGFSIRHGHADGVGLAATNGGGIYSDGAPTIQNCTFEQNYATQNGGAIYQRDNTSLPLVLENCMFKNNSAKSGMTVYLLHGKFDIGACDFKNNVSHGALPAGTALYIIAPGDGAVRNCTFQDNQGGLSPGMLVWQQSSNAPVSVEIIDCTFAGNNAWGDINGTNGAGLTLVTAGNAANYTVKGCTFSENNSMGSGGGLAFQANPSAQNVTVLVDSCIFSNNVTNHTGCALYTSMSGENLHVEVKRSQFLGNTTILPRGAGAIDLWATNGATGTAIVDDCYFEGNYGDNNGALELGNKHQGGAYMDFFVKNSVFKSNEATVGGAISIFLNQNSQTDVVIEDCAFFENKGLEQGGAINIPSGTDASIKIARCTLDNNDSPKGGAVFIKKREAGNTEILIENSLITNNKGAAASIFVDSSAYLTLLNCTIADNLNNGIELANKSTLKLQNTILHNNGTSEFEALTNDVSVTSDGGNLLADNSFMEYAQSSDLQNADPQFAGSGDLCNYYQLSDTSPAINQGVAWLNAPDSDLCGSERIQEGQIDIGALESSFTTSIGKGADDVLRLGIAPNPATNFLNIQLPENTVQAVEASLYDAQGKLVKRETLSPGQVINLNGLEDGLYLIKIDLLGKVMVGRFIKL